ncbi:hypothetical protein CKO35_02330 [Ectothiorhodospira shaposhnikovii]|uniref:DUF4194 domain-containing protein n=1 Tax=Ectothiorhodospira shaposhnikovii TaxID=1054 RepID=UPI0019082024|nr:DUF4194 domain-containing protein [Ectothiorhodospira shaposhnikovii]MBK1672154.1 hypothetical protein [Ectothiorhodospira shaposhnikovii]
MLRDMRQVLERGEVTEQALREAASALLSRQFLFLRRPRDRDVYRVVVNNHDYFLNLFDALGWGLHRDDESGFLGLLPDDAQAHARLRLVETLMLLCLRLLYEEGMDRFQVRDGCVHVEAEDLLGRYETLLGRKRPVLTEMRALLARLARYGVIEVDDGPSDAALPGLRILPSIRLITDGRVMEQLDAYLPEEDTDTDMETPA